MNTKRTPLYISLALVSLFATSAFGADYKNFVTPTSLGQDVTKLNAKHKLGLKNINMGRYNNDNSYDCDLFVIADGNNKITEITITSNNDKCSYQVESSGIDFDSKRTKTVDILNQSKLEDIQFEPGCFNCPSRIELNDSLVINRPKDGYYTKVSIEGYNDDYLNFMAKTLFGNYTSKDYYMTMDKLEENLRDNPKLYNRRDFKIKAIKTYDLISKPISYEIGLK